MKIVYMLLFFLGMLIVSWLAYHLFQAFDDGTPARQWLTWTLALASAIALLVLLIRHYVRRQTDPNDK